jgi:lysophospholipase L1-like esterase
MSSDGIRPVTAFVGDSITAHGDWQRWFPEEDARNFGVGGNTTDDLLERLDEVIAAQPSTVVLLIGANDFSWRRPVEHVVRNIETALVRLRRGLPDAQIVIQSVMPRHPEYAQAIKEVNPHLRQFATTVRSQYLDLWPALATQEGGIDPACSDDELHLNDHGYEVWLSELRPALETVRNQPPTSRAILLPKDLG